MKTQTIAMRLNGIFKVLILTLFCCNQAYADIVDHVFEKTIEIDQQVTIKTNGMELPRLDFTGWVSSSNEKGAYTLKTRDVLFLKVDKRFNVHTWDKNQIKHIVKVTVRAASNDIEQNFLSALRQELSINPAGNVDLSNMLGVQSITMKNGWLRSTENTVLLKNGSKFVLDYLEISAEVYVPKSSNFEILNAHYTDFFFGKLDGKLTLELEGGSIEGTFINEVVARINSSEIRLAEVDKLDVSGHQSRIFINNVNVCIIGKLPFKYQNINSNAFNPGPVNPIFNNNSFGQNEEHNSSLNKYKLDYVQNMKVFSSASDKIDCIELGNLELRKTNFTDLAILNLQGALAGTMSYGELDIMGFEPLSNRKFDIESFNGTLRFYGSKLEKVAVHVITNAVESDLEVNSKGNWPENDQRLLTQKRSTDLHFSSEYVLKNTMSYNKSTNKTIYLKGAPKENDEILNIYCNSCELIIH